MGEEGLYIAKKVPVLSTTQRDLLIAVEGMLIFNSTTDQLEEYDGGTWEAVGQVILTTHTADLDAHTKNMFEELLIGAHYCSVIGPSTAGALTANNLYAIPLLVSRDMTVDRIGIEVAIAGTAGCVIRLGLYEDDDAYYPGALLLDAGTVAGDTTGVKLITIDQALTKGRYWAVAISDAAPSPRTLSPGSNAWPPLGCPTSAYTTSNYGYKKSQTYGALPSTFPSGGTGESSRAPIITVRIESLD